MPPVSRDRRYRTVRVLLATISVATFTFSATHLREPHATKPLLPAAQRGSADTFGRLPLSFEPNVGQTDSRVQFLSRGNGYTMFFAGGETVVALRNRPQARQEAVRMMLAGARRDASATPLEALPGVTNYFIGNDPRTWHANVPNYARVQYHDLYPGIDVVYYGNQRQLEYDFLVAPGADPRAIAVDIEGAESLDVDAEGNLLVNLTDGAITLKKPFAYQDVGGSRREIAVDYSLHGPHEIRLLAAAYDHEQVLVIDPVLAYGTYLGGTGLDVGIGIAVDGTGNTYVSGVTSSLDFPTAAPAQSAIAGGTGDFFAFPIDGFVSKLNAAGSALLYSTYLGGASDDLAFSIALDAAGNAYVTGITESTNFPTTAGAYQTSFGGGSDDAFVTKLNTSGGLVYSTYIGGQCGDHGLGIAVDASGSAYMAGDSNSGQHGVTCNQTYPITPGAFQSTHGSGGPDGVITKLNPAGSALVYSTFLGGAVGSPPDDSAHSIAVDANGNAYVAGYAGTTDFPTTPGAFQRTLSPRQCGTGQPLCFDAFVTKLNSTGSALLYSTFLGGGGSEEANGIAIDSAGNAYVTGYTESTNFPTTAGAYQTAKHGSGTNAFVVKLNPTGSALVSSTLLGGSTGVPGTTASDVGSGIAVDGVGNVFVTGHTRAADFPTTAGALQTTHGGGTNARTLFCENGYCDGFVARFNPTLSVLSYSTYLGGSGDDSPSSLALDAAGSVYVTGGTTSSNFLTTAGALQATMPAGGVSGTWSGPDPSHPPNIISVDLQRNGDNVTGIFNFGATLIGTLAWQSGGTFAFNIVINPGSSSNCTPQFTGAMTVDTVNNALSSTFSGTNQSCMFESDTLAFHKTVELASGFVVKLNLSRPATSGDFDGDGKADITVFRPSNSTWYTLQSKTSTLSTVVWGASTDVPVPGDYDGDGKIDVAAYRPSTGTWYILLSSTSTLSTVTWGGSSDVPVSADYDGDGKTDIAVFRPSTGTWYILRSSTSTLSSVTWGAATDVPVPGDYDGDGNADIAVYRPSTGAWYILQSSSSTLLAVTWGGAGTDVPVVGDYDGDGRTDIAVYRRSTGTWYILASTSGFSAVTWGSGSDVPVPADYDGDGKTDIAVFRPSTGTWYILQSSTSTLRAVVWGSSTDMPVTQRP